MKAVPNNVFRTDLRWYYVHRSRENNLIKQKTTTTIQNHPKEIRKTKGKEPDDEPTHRQEVKIL